MNIEAIKAQCENCRWWRGFALEPKTYGDCLIQLPPQLKEIMTKDKMTLTAADYSCALHSPKEPAHE